MRTYLVTREKTVQRSPLHELLDIELHVVAEIIEAELVVGAVSDVACVRRLSLRITHVMLYDSNGHSEESIDAPHPLRVSSGEVVIDGDDVDALATEGI